MTPGEDQLGTIQAISAETGETVWTHDQPAFTMSLVATGGGLIFGGDANGRFKALDHETGDVLWEINLGSRSPASRSPTRRRHPIRRGEHRQFPQYRADFAA